MYRQQLFQALKSFGSLGIIQLPEFLCGKTIVDTPLVATRIFKNNLGHFQNLWMSTAQSTDQRNVSRSMTEPANVRV
jgi:hypothetical protein